MSAVQTVSDSIRYLQIVAEMEKSTNGGFSAHQFVLDYGRMFNITPKSFPRRGKMKVA